MYKTPDWKGLPVQSLAPIQNGVNIPGSKHLGMFGQDQYTLLSQQLFSGQLQKGRHAQESARCKSGDTNGL